MWGETFWWIVKFWIKIFFNFWDWVVFFIFSGKVSCKYLKLQSTCPGDLFQDYYIPLKKIPPDPFRNLNGKLSAFPRNFSIFLEKWVEKTSDVYQMFFRQFIQKCALRNQRNVLTKNKVLRKKVLRSFLEVELFAWRLSSKSFRPVVKTALYVSGSFFQELFLPENCSSKAVSQH